MVGATTSNGGEPRDRGFSPGDLLATIYQSLGIDPTTPILDRQKRPVPHRRSGPTHRRVVLDSEPGG